MKRSEMIKIMVDELVRWQDEDAKFGGGFESCMYSILKAQEKAGMLPPKSLDTITLKKGVVRGYTMMFEWEQEGDE